MNAIRTIEELAINAWPALQTLLFDGWVLRCANGYTRRSNSVSPLYPGTTDTAEKIRHCEHVYRAQGLNTAFKLTSAVHPADLDDQLDAHGYRHEALTGVYTLDLHATTTPKTSAVMLSDRLTGDWFDAFSRMNQVAESRQAAHRHILHLIQPAACFAAVQHEGAIIACGLGVLERGFIGLFDIVTDPAFRRQGHGRRVVGALLDWGIRCGAHTSYLQVMLNNDPALRLYAAFGFSETYRYWYRVKEFV